MSNLRQTEGEIIPSGTSIGDVPTWNGSRYLAVPLSGKFFALDNYSDSPAYVFTLTVPPAGFAIYVSKSDGTPLLELIDGSLSANLANFIVDSSASGDYGFELEQPDGAISLKAVPSLTSSQTILFPEISGTVVVPDNGNVTLSGTGNTKLTLSGGADQSPMVQFQNEGSDTAFIQDETSTGTLFLWQPAAGEVRIGVNNVTKFSVFSTGVIMADKFTSYNGHGLEGEGFPGIVDSVELTTQGADISVTACSNTTTAGQYQISYYLEVNTADVLAGAVTVNFDWSNATKTHASSALSLVTSGVATYVQNSVNVYHSAASSSSIRYSVTHTGRYAVSKYNLFINVKKLS